MTGHRQRVWVLDARDDKLYAYVKLNIPASFTTNQSVRFKIHHSLPATGLIGVVPEATDPDGDSLRYHLKGADSSRFRIDRNLLIRSSYFVTFSAGENLSFVLTVNDGKGLIDRSDHSADDSVTMYVDVLHNADPEFDTHDGATFTVAENASETAAIANLHVSDQDWDTLEYEIEESSEYPFRVTNGKIKLKTGESLDY